MDESHRGYPIYENIRISATQKRVGVGDKCAQPIFKLKGVVWGFLYIFVFPLWYFPII